MSRVLIVDDERRMLRMLGTQLTARGYEVDLVETGEAAIARGTSSSYDIAIVDLGLPGIDGIEVVHGLRSCTSMPIIVLSAWHEESRKIRALDAGADDYVTKPFSMGELLARLRAGLRRARPVDEAAPVVETIDFRIDFATKRATTRERNRDRADADAVASRRDPGAESRSAGQPTGAARRGVGPELREPDELPASVHGAGTPQVRARPRSAAVLPHPTGHGDTVRARRSTWTAESPISCLIVSSARFSSSTFTAGSPRIPSARPSVFAFDEREHACERQVADRRDTAAPGASRSRPRCRDRARSPTR